MAGSCVLVHPVQAVANGLNQSSAHVHHEGHYDEVPLVDEDEEIFG
jgi:hypothetical protein